MWNIDSRRIVVAALLIGGSTLVDPASAEEARADGEGQAAERSDYPSADDGRLDAFELLAAMDAFLHNIKMAETMPRNPGRGIIQRQARFMAEYARVLEGRSLPGRSEIVQGKFKELAQQVRNDATSLNRVARSGRMTRGPVGQLSTSFEALRRFTEGIS